MYSEPIAMCSDIFFLPHTLYVSGLISLVSYPCISSCLIYELVHKLPVLYLYYRRHITKFRIVRIVLVDTLLLPFRS